MNIEKEIIRLKSMKVSELLLKYADVYGEESRSRNKGFLVKRIAWRMQANLYGDISDRALKRAESLANDADIRVRGPFILPEPESSNRQEKKHSAPVDPRLPKPGTILTRQYKGTDIIVTVLEDGFEYEDQKYRTLSAIAKSVTGTNWNGFLFFGLQKRGK